MSKIPESPCEYGLVQHFPRLNFGRGAADEAKFAVEKFKGADESLVDSFARTGRHLDMAGIETCGITDALADEAVELRSATLEKAKKDTSSLAAQIWFAILSILWTDSKGKVIRPTMVGVTGNRRAHFMPFGFLRRCEIAEAGGDAAKDYGFDDSHKRKNSETVETWVRRLCTFTLPFQYRSDINIADEDAILMVQLQENGLKKEGAKPVSDGVLLQRVNALVNHGKTQADIVRAIGSIGQKYYQVIQLSRQMPELDLLNRVQLKSDDARYISFGKLPNSLAPAIAMTSSLDSVRDAYNRRKNKSEDIVDEQVTDPEVIEKWLREKTSGSARESMMERKEVERLIGLHTSNPVVKETLTSVFKNDASLLVRVTDMQIGLSALYRLHADPTTYKAVEQLLVDLSAREPGERAVPTLAPKAEPTARRRAGRRK